MNQFEYIKKYKTPVIGANLSLRDDNGLSYVDYVIKYKMINDSVLDKCYCNKCYKKLFKVSKRAKVCIEINKCYLCKEVNECYCIDKYYLMLLFNELDLNKIILNEEEVIIDVIKDKDDIRIPEKIIKYINDINIDTDSFDIIEQIVCIYIATSFLMPEDIIKNVLKYVNDDVLKKSRVLFHLLRYSYHITIRCVSEEIKKHIDKNYEKKYFIDYLI